MLKNLSMAFLVFIFYLYLYKTHNMKYKIIITAFCLFFTICVNAQDKYQFMVIKYKIQGDPTLYISIDGEELVKEKVIETKDVNHDLNPLLKKVKEQQNKGWEVISFNNSTLGVIPEYYSYLRKKIEAK